MMTAFKVGQVSVDQFGTGWAISEMVEAWLNGTVRYRDRAAWKVVLDREGFNIV